MEEQEIQKVHGLITYIKVTKEGEKFGKKWKLYSIKLDSSEFFYSAFGNTDDDPYSHYSEGDNILLEYIVKGEYHNIKSIKAYNPESEKIFKEYGENSLKEEIATQTQEMIIDNLFNGEFNLNGVSYEISIKKK